MSMESRKRHTTMQSMRTPKSLLPLTSSTDEEEVKKHHSLNAIMRSFGTEVADMLKDMSADNNNNSRDSQSVPLTEVFSFLHHVEGLLERSIGSHDNDSIDDFANRIESIFPCESNTTSESNDVFSLACGGDLGDKEKDSDSSEAESDEESLPSLMNDVRISPCTSSVDTTESDEVLSRVSAVKVLSVDSLNSSERDMEFEADSIGPPAIPPKSSDVEKILKATQQVHRCSISSGSQILSFSALPAPPAAPSPVASVENQSLLSHVSQDNGTHILESEPLPSPPKLAAKSDSSGHVKVSGSGSKSKGLRLPVKLRSGLLNRSRRRTPAYKIIKYVMKMGSSSRSVVGRTVHNFIICTRDKAHEAAGNGASMSATLTSNVRQFLDGMRNYVMDNKREQLDRISAKYNRYHPVGAALNVETVVETALQKCVVVPLKTIIWTAITDDLAATGQVNTLHSSMGVLAAAQKSQADYSIRDIFIAANPALAWAPAVNAIQRIGKATIPIRKLEALLDCVTHIHVAAGMNAVSNTTVNRQTGPHTIGADDFLPIFIYVLVQSQLTTAEAEAEYMWGLLDPSILTGEAGYYLTVLSSAIHVLKATAIESKRIPRISDMQGFLRVYFTNRDAVCVYKTFPLRPTASVRKTAVAIMDKIGIDPKIRGRFGLFELSAGIERLLDDNETPHWLKSLWPPDYDETYYRFVFHELKCDSSAAYDDNINSNVSITTS